MRKIILSGLVVLTAFSQALAQKTAPAKQQKIEARLMQIERDIGQANLRRDKAYFSAIEADEFIFTDSAGGATTRAEDLAGLDKPEGDVKLVSYDVDEMKVSVYGDTAVVTGRTTTLSRGRGREFLSKSRFTDVFVKRKGKWLLVAGHASRIREPQK